MHVGVRVDERVRVVTRKHRSHCDCFLNAALIMGKDLGKIITAITVMRMESTGP